MVLREYVEDIRIVHQTSGEPFEPFSAFVVSRRLIALTCSLDYSFQVLQAGSLLGEVDLVLIARHVGGEISKSFFVDLLYSGPWVAVLG